MKTLYQKSKTCLLIIVTLTGIIWGFQKRQKNLQHPLPLSSLLRRQLQVM